MDNKIVIALAQDENLKMMYECIHEKYKGNYDKLVLTYCKAVSNKPRRN